eukprot:gene11854-14959_t
MPVKEEPEAAEEAEEDIDFGWDDLPEDEAAGEEEAPPKKEVAEGGSPKEDAEGDDQEVEVKDEPEAGTHMDHDAGDGEEEEHGAEAGDEEMAEAEEAEEQKDGPSGSRTPAQPEKHVPKDLDRRRRTMTAMTDTQLNRYESFRRSSMARPKIKKVMQSLLGYPPTNDSVIAMGGMCKVLVGELVEAARELASADGHTGPLLPKHIHYAYQNLNIQHKMPHHKQIHKRMFR